MYVLIKNDDGSHSLHYSYRSYRRGPIGDWFVGDLRVSDMGGTVLAFGDNARHEFDRIIGIKPAAPDDATG